MSNAHDLLRRTLEVWDDDLILEDALALMDDIRAYLADPNPSESIKNQEVDRTRKPMTPKERSDSYIELEETIGPDAHLLSFLSGIAAAEGYHKISGGSDE